MQDIPKIVHNTLYPQQAHTIIENKNTTILRNNKKSQ